MGKAQAVLDADQGQPLPTTGLTVREFARLWRVGTDKVRGWIRSRKLGAINTSEAECGKPRFVILPEHIAEFTKRREVAPPRKLARRRKRTALVDYYPD
jgi:hypothetical protein